ncbi:uncharacterized protein M6G45_016249 isoform 1-T2 [Spheniscus humboldti]
MPKFECACFCSCSISNDRRVYTYFSLFHLEESDTELEECDTENGKCELTAEIDSLTAELEERDRKISKLTSDLGDCDAKISKCDSSLDGCRGAYVPAILSLKMGAERGFPAENLRISFCRLSNVHNSII